MTFRPVIPIPDRNYVFYARIIDQGTGLAIRTTQSGIHRADIPTSVANLNNGVWLGAGQGTAAIGSQGQTGTIHSITLQPGVYRLEAWGASGGRGNIAANASVNSSRWGGYTQTHIRIDVPTTVFIVPGGAGANSAGFPLGSEVPGGFNGGGSGFVATTAWQGGGGGGGASHIALVSGLLSSQPVRDNIIIVAGGAGGGGTATGSTPLPGHGGGLTGGAGGSGSGLAGGGTQVAGGAVSAGIAGVLVTSPTAGSEGQGGSGLLATTVAAGGGGGGWFGGGGGARRTAATAANTGGGGGSSHIAAPFAHVATALAPIIPASATGGAAAGTGAANILTPTGAAAATTPRHPGDAGVAASVSNVLGGAVRITRLQ